MQPSPMDVSAPHRPAYGAAAVAALEAQVARDLTTIEVGLREWVPERRRTSGEAISDVVIVGAGLSGLSVAFGLKRQGVQRILLIDAAPEGREGPWITTARMRTLRSPKTLTGPDLGIPSLTYRAWHEATYGSQHWETLDKIDRIDWMAYLGWFRSVLALNVCNDTKLIRIEPDEGHLRLLVEREGVLGELSCRKVVLATGLEGAGSLNVPDAIRENLPRQHWTHSGDEIDAGFFVGKRIGVLGAAASSFDWAVAALEAGAESVTVLARSTVLPRTELLDWSNFPGFLNHFADLDDHSRYRFARRMFAFKTPPTNEMFNRAMAHEACRLVTGASVRSVAMEGEKICIGTAAGDFRFDHLLLGTGYRVDLSCRPELSNLIGSVATWEDRFIPNEGEDDRDLLAYPYLGPAFEFLEKTPGSLPMLANIHVFNNAAVPSLGPVCNGITGLKSGVPKLVSGICRGLFKADIEHFYRSLDDYDKIHFQPEYCFDGGAA